MKNLAIGTATFGAALATMGTAAAGLPCYPSPRFTVSANNNEVVDGKTGLTWQRGVAPVAKKWADANAYCPTIAGGNFRLPSVKELLTIVDFTKSNPSIDTTVFTDTMATYFWTSSPVAGSPSLAWVVGFNVGGPGPGAVGATIQVRCVR